MQLGRLFKLVLALFALLCSHRSHGQWVETYYDCICSGISSEMCSSQLEETNSEFHTVFAYFAYHPQDPKEALAQIRSAQIILDQRNQIRSEEEGQCLQYPLFVIKHAAVFAARENSSPTAGSALRIFGLKQLSKQAYEWAEKNCFNQPNGPFSPLKTQLPSPNFCRTK